MYMKVLKANPYHDARGRFTTEAKYRRLLRSRGTTQSNLSAVLGVTSSSSPNGPASKKSDLESVLGV